VKTQQSEIDRDRGAKKRKLDLTLGQQYADRKDDGQTIPRSPGVYE
jgi:hypothetical protein